MANANDPWRFEVLTIPPQTQHYHLRRGAEPLRYADVLDLWQNDESFRGWFSDMLAAAPFAAYRWETPAITAATVDRPFEFVLLDCPGLDRPPDRAAFAEHFSAGQPAVAFANLGKDAHLIVPCPQATDTAYGHLTAFVRQAPAVQRDAFWRLVGLTVQSQLGKPSPWLSTAGMGVAWLHVRLDTRPKYYGHKPYQQPV